MQLIDLIIIGFLVILAGSIIYFKIQKIKKKGLGCDCGCGSCSGRANCSLSEKK